MAQKPPLSDVCKSKRGYTNAREALLVMYRHNDKGLAPYRCPVCHCWHLGHTRQADKHIHKAWEHIANA